MEVSDQLHALVTLIPEEALTTIIVYEATRNPELGSRPLGSKDPDS